MNKREMEDGLARRPGGSVTYSGYLALDQVLEAQHPLTQPAHHDETLFIIQHQVSELWFKLILHEMRAAIGCLQRDEVGPCAKILARIKVVQRQLYGQWAVLETLTPSDYAQMRGVLGNASGFQSLQYRKFEFLLGNRNQDFVRVHGEDTPAGRELQAILDAPGLYDEFLFSLARAGYAVPAERLDRDWSQPVESHPDIVAMFKTVYENTDEHWKVYAMCEKLVDIEQNFQIWRFRHVNTVERVIGFKRGTGGSSGVGFLKKALEVRFFPELFDVRTEIGA